MWKKILLIIKGNFNYIISNFSYKSKKRVVICNNCEKLELISKIKVCGVCGCIIKAKVTIQSEQCPLNKWNNVK